MIEPAFLSVDELATRWSATPRQILEHGLLLRLPICFLFDGRVYDYPHHTEADPSVDFLGYVRASPETINRLMQDTETPFPIWAYHIGTPITAKRIGHESAVADGRVQRLAPGRSGKWKDSLKMGDLLIPLADIKQLEPTQQASSGQVPAKRVSKADEQERSILGTLRSLGCDPRSTPKPKPGNSGVKSEAWNALKSRTDLFTSRKTFNTAWERLRGNGDIVDHED